MDGLRPAPAAHAAPEHAARERALASLGAAKRAEASLLDRAFTRAAGTELRTGNAVRVLRDATENYPAWLAAIASAERYVHFESYIVHDDDVGDCFADALIERARAGVAVRVLYDWMGAIGKTRRAFWARLRAAGVEVRVHNPPRVASPFGWIHRDHRKMIAVDGRVGFVTGLCVGRDWAGDAARGVAPWRDTGVELRGPAVRDVEAAFADVWAHAGAPLPADAHDGGPLPAPAGDVAVRVIATTPWTAGLIRLDQVIAGAARETLWLTDAYFAALPSYVQALRAASTDGVDVRLLVPGASDIPWLAPLTQAGFRPLLEAGVRVFEWNGPMLHAKTAVADGRWARIGSSNLNVASWLGNHELDVAIEDAGIAATMARMYEDDLANATEVVLAERRLRRGRRRTRVERRPGVPAAPAPDVAAVPATIAAFEPAAGADGARPATGPRRRRRRGSATRLAAGALRLGTAVGGAVTGRRVLAHGDLRGALVAGFGLLALAALVAWWPRLLAWPLAALAAWVGLVLVGRAVALARSRGG